MSYFEKKTREAKDRGCLWFWKYCYDSRTKVFYLFIYFTVSISTEGGLGTKGGL